MADDKKEDLGARSGGDRATRQAKALRENLRRRKDQARQRHAAREAAPPDGRDERG